MFCHACPKFGAECPGGDVVISNENWFANEELKYNQTLNVSRSDRRLSKPRPNNLTTIVKVYQCSIGACAGNNTCLGQRTGVLCNMCPEGYSMEANACTKCDSNPDMQNTWQATLAVINIPHLRHYFIPSWLDSNSASSAKTEEHYYKTEGQGRRVVGGCRKCKQHFPGF